MCRARNGVKFYFEIPSWDLCKLDVCCSQVDFSTFGFAKYLRAAALLVNGVEPVELNPNFMEQLFSAAAGKGIIIYDEIGGTLEPTATFGNGKTSRSLLAVYQVGPIFCPLDISNQILPSCKSATFWLKDLCIGQGTILCATQYLLGLTSEGHSKYQM